jgi:glyoxylase I family protein
MRLHHVAVNCADLDHSVRFYREGLGLGEPYLWQAPPLVSRAAFIPFGDGGWLELFAGGEDAAARAQMDVGLTHMAIAVDDVDEAFERLVAAGGIAADGPATRTLHGDPPIEARMAFVVGPDGEVIELYRNDHFQA